jgi:hypothetical protein
MNSMGSSGTGMGMGMGMGMAAIRPMNTGGMGGMNSMGAMKPSMNNMMGGSNGMGMGSMVPQQPVQQPQQKGGLDKYESLI